MTRVIKGIQKEINFLKSEQIATIACAPKATFYGDNNAFDSQEEQEAWEESATNPRVLAIKPGSLCQPVQYAADPDCVHRVCG